MSVAGKKIGFGLTGSFCTLENSLVQMEKLAFLGADILPIVSYMVKSTDTRFGSAQYFIDKIRIIAGKDCVDTIVNAEPIGPTKKLDLMVVMPCTGNTLSKLANGITDTPVTMACKAHLRNNKPLLLGIATNDGLGSNAKNIGILLNTKTYILYHLDKIALKKYNSLMCCLDLFINAVEAALIGEQIQPVLV